MKIAVRALVLGMLITGFAADHVLATKAPSNATIMVGNSAAPIPVCEPGSGGCGLR